MARDPYLAMALNNAWANATLYGALAGLAPGAFAAPAPGFFPSLAATLNHIHEVDLYYIDALEGGGAGRSVYEREMEADPVALGRAQAEADRRLAAFCGGLGPAALSARRATERPGGRVLEERVDALLLHLFQHQIHHRGQAHVQLQAAGLAPPQLDAFHLDFERAPSAAAYHP
ncbi:DinB family protein [Ovoidimarina sediminis]|uniref:DinB family protein n=1 Tax=Ovoidimarina sediminis TaxID=3079856 RepID=UPI0029123A03|nr:DinB family protein [Rhodophyticola sp. MJ-SS7]MDU8942631.1 DinB family protein [Rhodophyticola sp. MJ-SS7]